MGLYWETFRGLIVIALSFLTVPTSVYSVSYVVVEFLVSQTYTHSEMLVLHSILNFPSTFSSLN